MDDFTEVPQVRRGPVLRSYDQSVVERAFRLARVQSIPVFRPSPEYEAKDRLSLEELESLLLRSLPRDNVTEAANDAA